MKAPWTPPKGDNFKGKSVEFSPSDEKDPAFIEAERLMRRETV